MRILNRILAGLVVLLALNACKSNKELLYLKNLPDSGPIESVPFSTDLYPLHPGDNLYVQITSLNPEVNALFSPGGESANASQQFASPSVSYLNGYLVNQKGIIQLPVVGQVEVEGKTLEEAQQLILDKVSVFVKDATVSVKLLNFRVTVMGEIAKPGVYYSYNNTYNLLEALSDAGGTTDYTKLNKALVIRQTPKGKISIDVDLTDKAVLSSEAFYLQPNDIIYLMPDKLKNLKVNSGVYSLVFSSLSAVFLIVSFITK